MPRGFHFVSVGSPASEQPLLLFFPGMDGSTLSMQQQQDGLSGRFDLRCLVLPAQDNSSWDEIADKILGLIQQEWGSDRPIYLCGESFGACLALKLASTAPERFARLILINSASSFQRQSWRQCLPIAAQQLSVSAYRLAATLLLPRLVCGDRVSQTQQQGLLQAIQAVSPQTVARRLSLLLSFDVGNDPLQQLPTPTLIVASRNDRLLASMDEAQQLATHIPEAKVVVLKHSGHACLLEHDIQLVEILDSAGFTPEKGPNAHANTATSSRQQAPLA